METEYRIHCKTFKGVYIMKPNWETKHTGEVTGPVTLLFSSSAYQGTAQAPPHCRAAPGDAVS